MIPAPFDYLKAGSVAEAVQALSAHGEDAKLLAGGHSLLPMMKLRLARPKMLVDLSGISELRGIREEQGRITIGALTTHYQIESSELLAKKCPLLPQTASRIGDVQVRNRGTIGGSLAHADPAADLPAAVLALGGELRLVGSAEERWVKAEDFFLGLMATAMRPTEVLAAVRLGALTGRFGTAYFKVPQKASGFAVVGVAVWIALGASGACEEVRVGVTGLDSKPFRARRVEDALRGNRPEAASIEKAADRVCEGVEPLEDLHASAEFRAALARLHTARALEAAAKNASGT